MRNSFKEIFNEKYSEYLDEGFSEEEAADKAGEYAQGWIEDKADAAYEAMKEKRLYEG